MKKKLVKLALAATLLTSVIAPAANAVSTSSSLILLYLNKKQAMVNEETVTLDAPATVINGRTFVPLRFLQESMGFQMSSVGSKITIVTKNATLILNTKYKVAYINGTAVPFNTVATLKNSRLLVQLKWVADYMGAKYVYHQDMGRIDIYYVKNPNDVHNGIGFKPVAKFTLAKTTYRVGEPVKYIDFSYDPDGDTLINKRWTGNEIAFFTPGIHTVSLTVVDSKGNVSDAFERIITVTNESYLTKEEYPIYNQPVETEIKGGRAYLSRLPEIPKIISDNLTRPILVSDAPETILSPGILYQDLVLGKARLYANHQNGMNHPIQFAIAVKNTSNRPVTITTTNKGEVFPSKFANLLGHQAAIDFLMYDNISEKMTVPVGETYVYCLMPNFFPGSGVNAFYDVESDGQVQFTFAAVEPSEGIESIPNLPELSGVKHIRGTFNYSETTWNTDGTSIKAPSRMIIGDGVTDPFVKGYDALEMKDSINAGNYGVLKKIHISNPPKMAVIVMARGGLFKGPIKINGEFIMVRDSGVLSYLDGPYMIAKTTGRESSLDIEMIPPAGSSFPIDLIFYPMQEK